MSTKATAIRARSWSTYLQLAEEPDARNRLLENVRRVDGGCWEWTDRKNNHGYGVLRVNDRTIQAHRLSLLIHRGRFDHSLDVDHLCRNPCCVNPDHLEAVTHGENVRRGAYSRLSGLCSAGHDDWRTYPSGRQCDTCYRARKGRKSRAETPARNPDLCVRGHLLAGENLVPSLAKRGKRSCRSCAHAHTYARDKRVMFTKALADRFYSKYGPRQLTSADSVTQ